MVFKNREGLEIFGDLKFVVGSKIRSKIILDLLKGPRKVGEIKNSVMSPQSTLTHAMGELESKNIVERNSELCSLSPKGVLVGIALMRFMESLDAIKLHEDFWRDHSILSIPMDFMMRLNVFRKAYTVESTPKELQKPYTTYLEMLKESKSLKSLLSACFPRHTEAINQFLSDGGVADIILTDDVHRPFIQEFGLVSVTEAIESGALTIRLITQKQYLSYMVSDNFFSMGLFIEGGGYDSSRLIMGHEAELIEWGRDLFKYHCSRSIKLDPDNIKTVSGDQVII